MNMAARRNDFTTPADFAGATALVCGAGMAGLSAARALRRLDANVLMSDDGPADGPTAIDRDLPQGTTFLGSLSVLPPSLDLVVTSPGLPPTHPLLVEAAARGIPILGELELAWRIQQARQRGRRNQPASWLMVTGTNGKTTTVGMLESILHAAGKHALAVGNVGVSIIDAVMADEPYEVLAVEASSFQLHFSSTLRPAAGAYLNLAPDHLEWHASLESYGQAKTKVWRGGIAIGNADDAVVSALLPESGAPRLITFTLDQPAPGQLGVVDGMLVDRAFHSNGQVLIAATEIRPAGQHNVANALAAAALARAFGISAEQIAIGLSSFVPASHRNQLIATLHGVRFIDDSKATNPHAAAASLAAYDRIIWIAGGQLKNAPVEDLVAEFADRLRGAVLLGADRDVIAAALLRHAPDLPVITVSRTDDGAMQDVVAAAASLAGAGDVVLLAPAAASKDMFDGYAARGFAFAKAVAAIDLEWFPAHSDQSEQRVDEA
jgi:UDP-N-acetylmuramoylalanine--D-glutamate ligase